MFCAKVFKPVEVVSSPLGRDWNSAHATRLRWSSPPLLNSSCKKHDTHTVYNGHFMTIQLARRNNLQGLTVEKILSNQPRISRSTKPLQPTVWTACAQDLVQANSPHTAVNLAKSYSIFVQVWTPRNRGKLTVCMGVDFSLIFSVAASWRSFWTFQALPGSAM